MARSSTSEARILEAARKVFLTEGYSAISTEHLCREAGVSKTTLYRYFGDMAGVLKAVVKKEGDAFSIDDLPLPDSEEAFWRVLETYGTELLKLLNTRFCLQLDRTMHEEARSHPDIASMFYDNAYGRAHTELTKLIEHGRSQGYIESAHPATELADYLLCMWEGLPYVKARLAMTEKPYPQPRRRVMGALEALFGLGH